MIRAVIFAENKTADKVNKPFVDSAKKFFGEKCLIWDSSCQKDLEYFAKNKDNRIYEGVLNYCYGNNIEFLYIIYMHHPEYLVAELNVRKYKGQYPKTKIIFGTDWRLMTLSDARIKATVDLLKENCVVKMATFSNIGPLAKYPGKICRDELLNNPKIKIFHCLFLADIKQGSKEEARKKFNIPQDKFIFLFFGSMFYGKGLDFLLKAMKLIENKNIILFISSSKKNINYEIDFKDFENNNIIWNEERIPDEALTDVYASCDALVLPYRKTYLNCGSSVISQAAQSHRPIVMASMTPYKEAVERDNLGVLFEPENIESLANALNEMYAKKEWFEKNAKFDEHLSRIESWDQFSQTMFGD